MYMSFRSHILILFFYYSLLSLVSKSNFLLHKHILGLISYIDYVLNTIILDQN